MSFLDLTSTCMPLIIILESIVKRAVPFPSLFLFGLKVSARSCTNLHIRFSIDGGASVEASARSATKARMCSASVLKLMAAAAAADTCRALGDFFFLVLRGREETHRGHESLDGPAAESSSRTGGHSTSAFFSRARSHWSWSSQGCAFPSCVLRDKTKMRARG